MRVRRCVKPNVAITLNENEPRAIKEGLGILGIENMITKEDVVVITPNWVNKARPEHGVVVGPESLRQVIKSVKACGPKRVVIATGPVQEDVNSFMEEIGFAQIFREEQVEFINLNEGPYVMLEIDHKGPTRLALNQIYEEMTFLISFTQLKMHEEATMSASIKNIAMGWPSAEEQGYPKKDLGIHNDLHAFITAMLEKFTIDLSIVSASPAMVGTGPTKGVANHTGLVICGTDPVATDVVGARFLGFKPQGVRYLYDAINKGLGCGQLDIKTQKGIQIKGMKVEDAEKHFSECVYGKGFKLE